MFSSKLRSFVGCCWYDSSGLIQTQNNSNIEIGKAANNYKKFFNLVIFPVFFLYDVTGAALFSLLNMCNLCQAYYFYCK